MSITFKQFEIIKAVVTTRSISKAAELVGLSQPTLSQQIAKLEKTLDTQLILRGRNSAFQLTPAGEYWYRTAVDILDRRADAEAYHLANFGDNGVDIRFSAPHVLRHWFFAAAAQVAAEESRVKGFEYVWSQHSTQVLERISTHQLNCGAVNAASVAPANPELHAVPVFRDRVVWIVPDAIPDDVVATALQTGTAPRDPKYRALARYVDLGPGTPWREHTQNWYRSFLPFALPFFRCSEHESASQVVAQGLATSHVPLAMILTCPAEFRSRIRAYEMQGMELEAAFVMPRHYLSVPAFVSYQTRVCDAVRTRFLDLVATGDTNDLPVEPDPSPQAGAVPTESIE